MNLKVKHLRSFLQAKNIAHSTCKEKNDLIELIRRYQTVPFVNIENRPTPSSTNFQQTFSTLADQVNNFAANLFGSTNEPTEEPVNQRSDNQHRDTNFQPTQTIPTTTMPQPSHEPRTHATAAPSNESQSTPVCKHRNKFFCFIAFILESISSTAPKIVRRDNLRRFHRRFKQSWAQRNSCCQFCWFQRLRRKIRVSWKSSTTLSWSRKRKNQR